MHLRSECVSVKGRRVACAKGNKDDAAGRAAGSVAFEKQDRMPDLGNRRPRRITEATALVHFSEAAFKLSSACGITSFPGILH
jgi:hypothetical protein